MDLEFLKTITILYVEDEKLLRDDVVANISVFVKEVIVASNGQEGLDKFIQNQDRIDLVISDILMPVLNGIDMIDKIREINQLIPIIYTTAFNNEEYLTKTISQSISAYIVKPIDIEILLTNIQKASYMVQNERLKASLVRSNQELEEKVKLKTKELQTKNKELYGMLYIDNLTALPNRNKLIKDLESIQNSRLLIIDIDKFKNVNEIFGLNVANHILIKITQILKEHEYGQNCTTYRIGYDVFALLNQEVLSDSECISKMDNIIDTINKHHFNFDTLDFDIHINVTIGVAKGDDVLSKANMALQIAKLDHLSFKIYENCDNQEHNYKNQLKWVHIINEAISQDNVVMYYQPIFDYNQKIIKYEALMRIEDQDEVFLPYLFLDIAKKSKLYTKLTLSMLKQVFQKVEKIKTQISVNFSIEDILDTNTILLVEEYLEQCSNSELIVFEILENENIVDYDKMNSFVSMVKSYGAKIAIDDFGSGYSNFNYLLELSPDYIKIDGSLIKNIDQDKNSYHITKAIVDFSHSLNIRTIAEYVHSKEIFDILLNLGVDEYQGFYLGKPQRLPS